MSSNVAITDFDECAVGSGSMGPEMTKRIYYIDDGTFTVSEDRQRSLADQGFVLERRKCLSESDIIRDCVDADALITMVEPLTRSVIEALPRLRAIARMGVGVDSFDVTAATECGVQVTNIPDANFREVAIHALSLLLSAIRGLKSFDQGMNNRGWNPAEFDQLLRRPSSLTVGVIGFGRSSAELARLAAAIGFKVSVYSKPSQRDGVERAGYRSVTLNELFANADVLSLHLPLTAETRHIIDRAALEKMRRDAIIVNVARGQLIDEFELVSALRRGDVGGAALDVFATEPLDVASELRNLPNVVATPHVAYLSQESLNEAGEKAVSEALCVLNGRAPTIR